MDRRCVVVFNQARGLATGKILQGEETVKELSFFLGNLQKSEPSYVDELIRKRYGDWAKVNGVNDIVVEHTTD